MTPVLPLNAAAVYVAGDDAIVRNAVSRLLALNPHLSATTIDPTLLEDLKDLSVSDFLAMVKSFPDAAPQRHLRAVPTTRDMRTVLSEREMEVVLLVAEGLSNKQISARLALSDKTIKNHISHILAKLNLSARTQVAIHAIRAGLV